MHREDTVWIRSRRMCGGVWRATARHMRARALLVFAIVSAAVRADATQHRAPCSGCTLDVPAGADPVPLVVVLHGDRDDGHERAHKWRAAVTKRGWALL